MTINRIEEILLEASTYFIKDLVVEEANRLYRTPEYNEDQLEECYEVAFKKILKLKGRRNGFV